MSPSEARKHDRLFVRDGRRHYRRRFSLTEVRLGMGILVVLAAIGAWVGWKGAHPDAALFEIPIELFEGGPAVADRGPLPASLAPAGWSEDRLSSFGNDDLYEKINGREDYYKSFGFQRLWFLSLVEDGDESASPSSLPRIVDLELFDLGTSPNALGAYAGERPPDVVPEVDDNGNGMYHTSENALFMTRGRYYLRALGSETGPEVRKLLTHVSESFAAHLSGEPLPWGYALFVGTLNYDPGRVSFMPENAFSFGFAQNVYAARMSDDQTEIFVVATASTDASRELAQRFTAGFLDYGRRLEGAEGPAPGSTASELAPEWVRDRYLNKVSGAVPRGRWVLGVRGAADVAAARTALGSLADGVEALPEAVVRQAAAALPSAAVAARPPEGEEYEGEEYKEETSQTLESGSPTPEN